MGSFNVLLIEEDPRQTELYADLVREVADCKVDVVSRLESSYDWIGRSSNYHLIVVNGPAGDADELSLLEHVKRHSPSTSVILISDGATVEKAVAAIKLGAEDYLKKPFSLEAFQLAVKRCFDRRAVFGGNQDASHFLNLLNSCQMISGALDRRKIFEVVSSYLAREVRSSHCAIYAIEGTNPVRVPDTGQGGQSDRAIDEILDISLHVANPMNGMAEAGEWSKFIDRGQLTPGLFVFRFRCAGTKDFFCVCLSPTKPASVTEFDARLRMLRAQIEVTGKNIEQYQGVAQLAYVDDATGLYNTRYLNNVLDREIIQSQTNGKSFAVLFVDADKFKGINDTHGHLVGTKILNELGAQLRKLVRDTDTCFRYGGDEFVAVLSGCDLPTARVVAERIRASVERTSFLADEGMDLRFTVSIGVALFPDHADSKKAIIEAADHAMYGSKKRSRNCVTIAELGASHQADNAALAGPAVAAPVAPVLAAVPSPVAAPAPKPDSTPIDDALGALANADSPNKKGR